MRHDGFSALVSQPFDHFGGRRRARPEAAFHRQDIDTAASAQQGAALHEPGQDLVHRRPVSQVQQFLGDQGRAFRQSGGVFQHLFGEGLHGGNLLNGRSMFFFLTLFKGYARYGLP